jgi:hypothetical protein
VVHYSPEEVGVAEEAGQVADHRGEHRVVHLVGVSGFWTGAEREERDEVGTELLGHEDHRNSGAAVPVELL